LVSLTARKPFLSSYSAKYFGRFPQIILGKMSEEGEKARREDERMIIG
jgi:hypothetical protein